MENFAQWQANSGTVHSIDLQYSRQVVVNPDTSTTAREEQITIRQETILAKKDKYLVGLDIGSTKTCALLAEMEDEQVRFLALGATESKGLRKGLIVNLDSTVSSIRRAVEEAESVANVPGGVRRYWRSRAATYAA